MLYPNIRCYICGGKVSFEDNVICLECGYIHSGDAETYFQIEPEEVKKKIDDPNIIILDVREELENKVSKLPNSILIPLNKLNRNIDKLDKNKEIIVYCHHGMRSYHAARFLIQKGFNAKHLRGGIHEFAKIDRSIPFYQTFYYRKKLIVRPIK